MIHQKTTQFLFKSNNEKRNLKIGWVAAFIALFFSYSNLAVAQEDKSVNEFTKHGLTVSEHWTDDERNNALIVLDFIEGTTGGNPEEVMEKYGHYPYKQHNRGIGDGIEGAVEALKTFKKSYPDFHVEVKSLYSDGEYIVTHSHTTLKKKHRGNYEKGYNVMDVWKVVDGKIVEHWDSMQPLNGSMRFFTWIGGGKIKNGNGVF